MSLYSAAFVLFTFIIIIILSFTLKVKTSSCIHRCAHVCYVHRIDGIAMIISYSVGMRMNLFSLLLPLGSSGQKVKQSEMSDVKDRELITQ